MIINDKAKEAAIKDIVELAANDSRFEDAADLDDESFTLLFKVVYLALKSIIKKHVAASLPIHLHNIGKLKIKPINIIAIKHKNKVAKEMGYNSFRDIPKDKIQELNNKTKGNIVEEYKSTRKRKNNVSVATFKIIDK